MISSNSDRNLLFGILALQMDFVNRNDLIAGMHAWVLEKSKSLGQILKERGALGDGDSSVLEALVQRHLERHDNDAGKSLAAIAPAGSIREALREISDPDMHASLAHLPLPTNEVDPNATRDAASLWERSDGSRFRILRPHARGGLGEVFVALDEEIRREVALKEMQKRYADNAERRARFLLEAEITGGLEHPGIVPVYGMGKYSDGRPFYAMRFIKGDNLREAIDRFHKADVPERDSGERSVAFRELLNRFVAVCNAIAYAHSRGVLHRDIKPTNIMLGKFGETLVVDWGLAKTVGGLATPLAADELTLVPLTIAYIGETLPGSAIGTPAYMSPEQAAGRLDKLGPASDVYGLGATLYCLLTGKAPIDETDMAIVLAKVEMGEIPRPRQVKGNVSLALEAICRKAMALKPEDRYQSARALADDVAHWMADEPVSVWREPWSARASRWVRKNKLAVGGLASILTIISTIAIAGFLLSAAQERAKVLLGLHEVAEGERKNAEQQREIAEEEREEANEQRALARRYQYVSEMNLAERAWHENQVDQALELLEKQQPALPENADRRGFEWHYLWRLSHRELRTLLGHSNKVVCVCYSPDGKQLASASDDHTVRLWDVANGGLLHTLRGHTKFAVHVTYCPDGKCLASAGWDGTIRLWDTSTGLEVRTMTGHQRYVRCVSFSPDGRFLASSGNDETVRVWDVETSQNVSVLNCTLGKRITRCECRACQAQTLDVKLH